MINLEAGYQLSFLVLTSGFWLLASGFCKICSGTVAIALFPLFLKFHR